MEHSSSLGCHGYLITPRSQGIAIDVEQVGKIENHGRHTLGSRAPSRPTGAQPGLSPTMYEGVPTVAVASPPSGADFDRSTTFARPKSPSCTSPVARGSHVEEAARSCTYLWTTTQTDARSAVRIRAGHFMEHFRGERGRCVDTSVGDCGRR